MPFYKHAALPQDTTRSLLRKEEIYPVANVIGEVEDVLFHDTTEKIVLE